MRYRSFDASPPSLILFVEGDPRSFQTSLRETMNLTKELDAFGKGGKGGGSGKAPALVTPSSFAQKNVGSPVPTTPTSPASSTFAARSAEALIDVLRLRENRLYRTEDVMAKFLEVIPSVIVLHNMNDVVSI